MTWRAALPKDLQSDCTLPSCGTQATGPRGRESRERVLSYRAELRSQALRAEGTSSAPQLLCILQLCCNRAPGAHPASTRALTAQPGTPQVPTALLRCGGAALGATDTSPAHTRLIVSECSGLRCVPQNVCSSPNPCTCEQDSIWKQGLCRHHRVKMRLRWVRVSPNPMTGVLTGGGSWDTESRPLERATCGWSRGCNEASRSQRMRAPPSKARSWCLEDHPCPHLVVDS